MNIHMHTFRLAERSQLFTKRRAEKGACNYRKKDGKVVLLGFNIVLNFLLDS